MKTIAWICVDFSVGSGGHRTVFQNFNYLASHGYKCDLYVVDAKGTEERLSKKIEENYFKLDGHVYIGRELKKKYDMVIATYFSTARYVSELDVKNKMYFIQDYEPWFFPMSENYLVARESYKYGLNGVSIGRWLSQKLQNDFGTKMNYFSFCADLNIYKKNDDVEKEDAICFIYQPDKPRRCAEMGLKALQIVQQKRPETKVYLYGSPEMVPYNIKAKHLGVLSVEKCNDLYNKCKVGLCISSSNPSRIPFEMMAAGLPVVDLYIKNNIYDLPDDGCLLAEPSAESIAAAILKVLDDEKIQKKMSDGGAKYMQGYPLERGFEEFKKAVDDCFGNKSKNKKKVEIIYRRRPVIYDGGMIEVGPRVYFRSKAEVEAERLELEARKKEAEWRKNLTTSQKICLKIRYILRGY